MSNPAKPNHIKPNLVLVELLFCIEHIVISSDSRAGVGGCKFKGLQFNPSLKTTRPRFLYYFFYPSA